MAIIPQLSIFSWNEIDSLGDLKRLQLVLTSLPDEALLLRLHAHRGCRGRNDHPVRGMWNSLLAGIVFQHQSAESLRRELARNAQLRELCGLLDIPSASAYTRFLQNLLRQKEELEKMFDQLVEALREILPGFGEHLAIDSKAISSWANHPSKESDTDGRRDLDANYGVKSYKGQHKDGKPWEKIVRWFGYKLHLVVDATYELPVAFSVTPASKSDMPGAHDLLNQMQERQPALLTTAQTMAADKGYDDGKLITLLWDTYRIKPIIDIRRLWKDPNETRLLPGETNAVYNQTGDVYCYCPETNARREMACGGFEQDRGTLKKRCPVKQYGITCAGRHKCPIAGGLRVPMSVDRRIFTPIDRSSYKWKREYKKRTAVERANSRLDVSFGFELHTIRGLAKMQMRCGLALCVMLAMAVGRIKEKRPELMRSLVRGA